MLHRTSPAQTRMLASTEGLVTPTHAGSRRKQGPAYFVHVPMIAAAAAAHHRQSRQHGVHLCCLDGAKHMLETADQLAATIANEVGYEDAGCFGRLFRRKVNLTPGQ